MEDDQALSLLGSREQMRTGLQVAAEGKGAQSWTASRWKGTDVLEVLVEGNLRSHAVLENVRG